MAETAQGKGNGNKVDPEATGKRLQEVGLSMVLAIPVALVAVETFGLKSVVGVQASILLAYGGIAFLMMGHETRRKIWENNKDCPKE